jgi:hypothetical protein
MQIGMIGCGFIAAFYVRSKPSLQVIDVTDRDMIR